VIRRRVEIRLLGPLTVCRDGAEVSLPASRKARALLAFLAAAPAPVTRSRLCELLWDVPDDPRGELRWSLSKLRGVVDDDDRPRVVARGETVALDLSDCRVDVAEVIRLIEVGLPQLAFNDLTSLETLFAGDFAEGLELDRNPAFSSWIGAQRRQFRSAHVNVLAELAARLADEGDAPFRYLEKWVQISPFDRRAHETLLNALLTRGRVQEGEEHLAKTIRLFEAEGLEWVPIREAWKAARARVVASAASSIIIPANAAPALATSADTAAPPSQRRASICVMPFADRTPDSATRGGVADGLTEDIITRLAKLRVLFVIARGSVYALGERNIPPEEAARLLNVDYVASGSVRRHNDRITVTVELAEARAARIVWADDFTYRMDDALVVLDEIGNRIVASIAEEVEMAERNRAILKPPSSLNAWEAYHRGLWHMYRFNGEDNARAAHFFERAIEQDRMFARAHAGLSFTHFQDAFLHLTGKREEAIARAFGSAGDALAADDRDPAAHWAMGRALWLRGAQDQSLQELETSVNLSPNFALGHYTLGFVHCQSGDAGVAISSTDYSRHLSPFDPLLFAMLATRALALLRLGRFNEAADEAVKAAARPNAHVHIRGIAANALAAAGRVDDARTFVASARQTVPGYNLEEFLAAFHFAPDVITLFRRNAQLIGFG
jgi:DNA-binding SARP family transcriptional activator/Flp pilus assembly protein TadD